MTRPSRPFTASFDDECAECGYAIVGGEDVIVMTDDGPVHTECAGLP